MQITAAIFRPLMNTSERWGRQAFRLPYEYFIMKKTTLLIIFHFYSFKYPSEHEVKLGK